MKTENDQKTLKCEKCGHEWLPRIARRPVACPGCCSRKWDVKKEDK